MADNRNASARSDRRETVCIDTLRVLDSCRDRDCFEDVRVFLSEAGQEIIDRTASVRAKSAEVVWAYVGVDAVPFNCGFYQVTVRFYIRVVLEACLGVGRNQEFEGISVVEKRVVLYGSVGNVSIYRSNPNAGACDAPTPENASTNLPVGVVEVVDPVLLSVSVVEPGICPGNTCCLCSDIPDSIASNIAGDLADGEEGNRLLVTIGTFSVIRLERPAQYLVSACDYSVPDKECAPRETDSPCSLFRRMSFPVDDFYPPSLGNLNSCNGSSDNGGGCSCSCGNRRG